MLIYRYLYIYDPNKACNCLIPVALKWTVTFPSRGGVRRGPYAKVDQALSSPSPQQRSTITVSFMSQASGWKRARALGTYLLDWVCSGRNAFPKELWSGSTTFSRWLHGYDWFDQFRESGYGTHTDLSEWFFELPTCVWGLGAWSLKGPGSRNLPSGWTIINEQFDFPSITAAKPPSICHRSGNSHTKWGMWPF